MTAGVLSVNPNTMYPLLRRLEEQRADRGPVGAPGAPHAPLLLAHRARAARSTSASRGGAAVPRLGGPSIDEIVREVYGLRTAAGARPRSRSAREAALALWRDARALAELRGGLRARGWSTSARMARRGRKVIWVSVPDGRGRVTEKVLDERGRPSSRTLVFEEAWWAPSRCARLERRGHRVELTLEYELTSTARSRARRRALHPPRAARRPAAAPCAASRSRRRTRLASSASSSGCIGADASSAARQGRRRDHRRRRAASGSRPRRRAPARGIEGRHRRPRRGRGQALRPRACPSAVGLALDVTDRGAPSSACLDAADEQLGNVDVLVNNAGIIAPRAVRGRGRRDSPAPGGHQRARRDVRHEDRAAALVASRATSGHLREHRLDAPLGAGDDLGWQPSTSSSAVRARCAAARPLERARVLGGQDGGEVASAPALGRVVPDAVDAAVHTDRALLFGRRRDAACGGHAGHERAAEPARRGRRPGAASRVRSLRRPPTQRHSPRLRGSDASQSEPGLEARSSRSAASD